MPLMLASVIGFAGSKLVCAEGVYHASAHNFTASSPMSPVNVGPLR